MRLPRPTRVPVWAWRALMARIAPGEIRRFNAEPIATVDYHLDHDYSGDGIHHHRLDVIAPKEGAVSLPVYIYFHGGGWTSGDKAALTKYCASQAAAGMVVVNVNYRMATRFQMRHIMHDAADALGWVEANIARFGGDPARIVLGGDSAGGQIAALLTAATIDDELAAHYGIHPVTALSGLVQHCSIVDFSEILGRGSVLGLGFIRMLLPRRGRGLALGAASRFLSPIEWVRTGFPPVFVTSSEQDYFYGANLNFIARLRALGVPVDELLYDRDARNTRHTWQQDSRFPESQAVYARLQAFVTRVAVVNPAAG